MQSIGRNDTTSVPGLCTPTMATIRPSVAAMLYAGAVEETAITPLEISPSAPARRPLSGGATGSAIAMEGMGDTAVRPARGAGLWRYCIPIPYCCTGFGYEDFEIFWPSRI